MATPTPSVRIDRARNGFVVIPLGRGWDGEGTRDPQSVCTGLHDLLEEVRAWAEPPKPATKPKAPRKPATRKS